MERLIIRSRFRYRYDNGNQYEALSETELLDKLEKSRQNAAQGNYRDASDVSCDMRAKYGL